MIQKGTLSDKNFQVIRQVVYEFCGINLKDDKRELVFSRLSKLVRKGKFHSFDEYLALVLRNTSSAEFTEFIDCLSTNLTSFFRESQHFEYLKTVVLPRMMDSVSGNKNLRIRCWSAGCSSGEEPYSLAMTLSENLPMNSLSNVKILASDISTQVLRCAAAGSYSADRLSGTTSALVRKYFESRKTNQSTHYCVRPELRNLVVFKHINLMANSWPITTALDFIFCRNVMIYFDKVTQQKLVNRFYETLRPGGILFIGHSESLSGTQHAYQYIAPTIYQKPQEAR